MGYEVVFDTEQDAVERLVKDNLTFSNSLFNNSITTLWCNAPQQRLDGKWTYPILPQADYTGFVIEEYNPSNYQQENTIP